MHWPLVDNKRETDKQMSMIVMAVIFESVIENCDGDFFLVESVCDKEI